MPLSPSLSAVRRPTHVGVLSLFGLFLLFLCIFLSLFLFVSVFLFLFVFVRVYPLMSLSVSFFFSFSQEQEQRELEQELERGVTECVVISCALSRCGHFIHPFAESSPLCTYRLQVGRTGIRVLWSWRVDLRFLSPVHRALPFVLVFVPVLVIVLVLSVFLFSHRPISFLLVKPRTPDLPLFCRRVQDQGRDVRSLPEAQSVSRLRRAPTVPPAQPIRL